MYGQVDSLLLLLNVAQTATGSIEGTVTGSRRAHLARIQPGGMQHGELSVNGSQPNRSDLQPGEYSRRYSDGFEADLLSNQKRSLVRVKGRRRR